MAVDVNFDNLHICVSYSMILNNFIEHFHNIIDIFLFHCFISFLEIISWNSVVVSLNF